MRMNHEHYAGCLLGGTLGDSLGEKVEFLNYDRIRAAYGPQGYLGPAGDEKLRITDDTQMTLFTAEGLLRAENRGRSKGIASVPHMVYRSYLRWLATQGPVPPSLPPFDMDGWLLGLGEIHAQRAPGNTCLSALGSGRMGTVEDPINNSKGCGGIMRAAPVGLFPRAAREGVFDLGCRTAAITHGHPSGYLSAGVLAELIHRIIQGASLEDALEESLKILQAWEGYEGTRDAILAALELYGNPAPHVENIEKLGGGWVGEEALAISLYSALAAKGDMARGLLLAVNHSGDSDSTGSITGNILGALLGKGSIPAKWLCKMELAREIEEVAADLLAGWQRGEAWWRKYPGS